MRLSAWSPTTTSSRIVGSTTTAEFRILLIASSKRPFSQLNLRTSTPDTSSKMNEERYNSNRPLIARLRTNCSLPGKFKPETITFESRTTLMPCAACEPLPDIPQLALLRPQVLFPFPLPYVPHTLAIASTHSPRSKEAQPRAVTHCETFPPVSLHRPHALPFPVAKKT